MVRNDEKIKENVSSNRTIFNGFGYMDIRSIQQNSILLNFEEDELYNNILIKRYFPIKDQNKINHNI